MPSGLPNAYWNADDVWTGFGLDHEELDFVSLEVSRDHALEVNVCITLRMLMLKKIRATLQRQGMSRSV